MSSVTNPIQAQARRLKAWECALQGMTGPAIVQELERAGLGKVSRQAVNKMLHCMRTELLANLKRETELHRAQQTAMLRRVYREALEAWERSKKPHKQITTRQPGPSSTGSDATVVVQDRCGDPRFRHAAMQALANIRRIWGMDAAIQAKLKVEGTVGLTMAERAAESPYAGATSEELRQIRALHDEIKQRRQQAQSLVSVN